MIIKLFGGLGNQFFQFAFGYSISKFFEEDLFFDTSFYDSSLKIKRELILKDLIKNIHIADKQTIKDEIFHNKISRYLYSKNIVLKNKNVYKEQDFRYDENVFNNIKKYYFGYWQSEKYFKKYENDIRNIISGSDLFYKINLDLNNKIDYCNSVSIHIRRGDYANNIRTRMVHGILPIDYYIKSMNIICGQIKNPKFLIFSDDIEWAKLNLPHEKNLDLIFVDFIDGRKDLIEFILMSKCKNHIIANSTFSWWSAWLSGIDGIKIAPKRWFNNNISDDDIIPQSWIRI